MTGKLDLINHRVRGYDLGRVFISCGGLVHTTCPTPVVLRGPSSVLCAREDGPFRRWRHEWLRVDSRDACVGGIVVTRLLNHDSPRRGSVWVPFEFT